jgi:hypothetical protein
MEDGEDLTDNKSSGSRGDSSSGSSGNKNR